MKNKIETVNLKKDWEHIANEIYVMVAYLKMKIKEDEKNEEMVIE